MPTLRRGHHAVSIALVLFTGCSELGRRFDGSLSVVDVLETPPPIEVEPVPVTPPQLLVFGEPIITPPELVFVEPLPLPVKHVVTVVAAPSGARRIDTVQSLEVEVEIEGGAVGQRTINAVFVSPQGVVWERQGTLIDAQRGQPQRAQFSLPVAATFIEDQQLSGTWQVMTLDEGVEQASTSFLLEAVTP